MPITSTPTESPVLFTEEGHKRIASMLKLLACERGFMDGPEGTTLTDEQGLKILLESQRGPLSVEQQDEVEALFDYIITRINLHGGDLSGVIMFLRSIDDLWFALSEARKKVGRSKPALH